ncbi:hypothetical protein [Kingella potus]|uniref:hypothetical protein n=1 Tax=Kingella potus TaxID=265175 RepID=UPI001FD22EB6|nr:hypothetical protein [Kingella potus]UOP01658.1 hypothetical protein LVJ84_05795 [Kingella potus]
MQNVSAVCRPPTGRRTDAGDAAAAFAAQSRLAVLAARREDAESFNEACRRLLAAQGRVRTDSPWFAGQSIMIERNDHALGLYNGDIGIVLPDPQGEAGALAACFPAAAGYRTVPLSRLPAHVSAFAITVHKSQGSEYAEVWLLPGTESADTENTGTETAESVGAAEQSGGLNRALLYTAVTRARQGFAFAGSVPKPSPPPAAATNRAAARCVKCWCRMRPSENGRLLFLTFSNRICRCNYSQARVPLRRHTLP